MRRLIAIPCLYYVEVDGDPAEDLVNAELLRVAWDSGAPIPDPTVLRPDMEQPIYPLSAVVSKEGTPEYRVILELALNDEADAFLHSIPAELLEGQHELLVRARNRYEAEYAAVHQFFSNYLPENLREHVSVIVTSIRMN